MYKRFFALTISCFGNGNECSLRFLLHETLEQQKQLIRF